jgi:hypothetical protein
MKAIGYGRDFDSWLKIWVLGRYMIFIPTAVFFWPGAVKGQKATLLVQPGNGCAFGLSLSSGSPLQGGSCLGSLVSTAVNYIPPTRQVDCKEGSFPRLNPERSTLTREGLCLNIIIVDRYYITSK